MRSAMRTRRNRADWILKILVYKNHHLTVIRYPYPLTGTPKMDTLLLQGTASHRHVERVPATRVPRETFPDLPKSLN